ncbi:MAG: ATP-binding protein [Thiothrix litoralis]|uniref:AAA family ATPase n=1 Tax=Thiothrix litoralis TaxID=2891210 RepID=UPI003C7155FB
MLKQLKIENFTVFAKADFEFSPGLNVIVGENGTGKSHVLKLAYAMIAESNKQGKTTDIKEIRKPLLQRDYAQKLINVFRMKRIDDLKRRQVEKIDGGFMLPPPWKVSFFFNEPDLNCVFVDPSVNHQSIQINQLPKQWVKTKAIFMPTRELLTIYPGFVSLYEGRYLEFDETYYDICLLLGEPPLKKPMTDLLDILENAMGGKVVLEGGRFYLVSDLGKTEMPLVAEGIRKLAMLAQLIAVGALQNDGYLFWDEPEANLNPRLVRVIARVILQLAKAGIQVFIATHSYFLLKELDILAMEQPIPTRYFSLLKGEDGVVVESGDSLDDLQTIVALDEELAQFDREQDAHHA